MAATTEITATEKIEELFERLVPDTGKADTVAGEIIRAVSRIGFRWNNDGDRIGTGYGRETCNPAARYLIAKADDKVVDIIYDMWGANMTDREYDDCLQELCAAVLNYLDNSPELETTPNTEDMFDYRDKYEDVDEYDCEDDCEDNWG